MADHSTLDPRLGHFLPYLLRRRLQVALWPASGGERAVLLLLLGLGFAYGAGLGFLLNHSESSDTANFLPKLLVGLNTTWLVSALLVDFLPALRPITRAVPEHFPVSVRLNVVTTFLLDFITLRRLLIVAMLLVALFPPSFWPLLGLLPLGAAAFTSLGIWGSFYQAKPVRKIFDFAKMTNNTSNLMSVCAWQLAAALCFLPWWWARIVLAALVTASAIWPIRAVLRNNGPLRRRL